MTPALVELLDSKPLYYTKFDPNRIIEAFGLVKNSIKNPKRIHIVGTNGKGSSGRALAHLASKSGLRVGHFSSPHILDFKERFWIDGSFATDKMLEIANSKLYALLGSDMAEALSYFEYQALLAFVLFENLDLQVIEAGLGGEYDATSVLEYDATIFTPIGIDHSDFLGSSIEDIANSKLKIMKNIAILAKQPYTQAEEIAHKIANKNNTTLIEFDIAKFKKISKEVTKPYPKYLLENFTLACQALDALKIDYKLQDLNTLNIFGRFYKLLPNVTIDVGHNRLAAKAISQALQNKVTLIFNILGDKDAKEVLKILKPKIDSVEIIKINSQRATNLSKLQNQLKELDIAYSYFDGTLEKKRDYLVFGSFYVVEAFLKEIDIKEIKA
jgi:dihydrofolate synthase/folylpolyglutamate synthase